MKRGAMNVPLTEDQLKTTAPRGFPRWMRKRRLARGWTQAKLASVVGVTGAQIGNIEAGRRGTSPWLRQALKRVLGLPLPTPAAVEAQAQMRQANDLGVKALVGTEPLLPAASVLEAMDILDGMSDQTKTAMAYILKRRST